MPLAALALALGSAVLHAAWNLLLARARDVQAAAAATFLLSLALAAPLALIWWHAEASVWPYALASSLFEIVYIVALAYAYRTGEVSFVYPLTRGIAPVLTLVVAVAVFGHRATAAEIGGVLLVAIGVVLVRGPGGRADAGSCSSRRSGPPSPPTRSSTAPASSGRAPSPTSCSCSAARASSTRRSSAGARSGASSARRPTRRRWRTSAR